MCTYFKTETEDLSIGRSLSENKNGGAGLIFEKAKLCVQKLLNSSYSATGDFLQYIYSVLMAKNHQKIRSKCSVHEFSVKNIFLNSALYGCGFLLLL